jgi:hypothetical protein
MRALLTLFLLSLTACGIHVSSDPVKVDPIQVTHTVTIDYDSIVNYCRQQCNGRSDFDTCTMQCYDNMIDFLNQVLVPAAGENKESR